MKLNPNLLVLENESELTLLKIGKTDSVIKMSSIEFEIITYYSKVLDFQSVKEYFKEEIEIRDEQMGLLIKKASESNILIGENTKLKTGSGINFIFKRNKRIFEVINFDFTNSTLEKLFENRLISTGIIGVFSLLFTYLIINIFSGPLNFRDNYIKTLYAVPVSFSAIFGYIYLAAFTSSLIHEFGHYFIYKRNYGKTSMFGLGLLFFFIPVVYNKVLVGLVREKRSRLAINSGGMFFDLLQLILLIFFTKNYHLIHPILSFFCYSLMISIGIRTFFNLNIFLPNSDGYFIFSELINKQNLFERARRKTKVFINKKEVLSYKNYVYALYAGLCYCFISISWCMIFIPIITYIYYAGIK